MTLNQELLDQIMKDYPTFTVVHEEVLNAEDIGNWAVEQGIGYFVYIPLDIKPKLVERDCPHPGRKCRDCKDWRL